MALAPGTRLGPYEVTAQIGVGGMGEVYRATDTNLARQVAIEVLPEAVAHDAERLTPFDREAKTLAAFNHPNIARIHGLRRTDGITALVMELVEGPTLADLIASGHPGGERASRRASQGGPARGGGAPRGLNIEVALPIARQIAEALEAAHERGIIHRDLKPANVKVREDGTVKVLDFGLAKAMEPAGMSGSSSVSMSPTITSLSEGLTMAAVGERAASDKGSSANFASRHRTGSMRTILVLSGHMDPSSGEPQSRG